MSIEVDLINLLGPLVGGRIYPDVTPENPDYPLIVYQQVGGKAYAYMENKLPDHLHARMQICVWSKRRIEASAIGHQVEKLLIESPIVAEAYGAFASAYEDTLKLYGTRQDFGIWFKD